MGLFVVIIIIAVVIYASAQNVKANREKWRAAARGLGLSFVEGGAGSVGTIQGSRNGHRVRVSTYTKGSGKSSQTYTKYVLEYRDQVPFDFRMTRQGAMQAIKQAFGFEDVAVGDPVFDGKVLVRSAQPDQLRAFLNQELREKVRVLIVTYPTIIITNGGVVVDKAGRDTDASVIAHCVRRLEGFCEDVVTRKQLDAKPAPEPQPEPARDIREDPSATPILEMPDPVEIEPVEPHFNPLFTANPIVPDPPMVEEVDQPLVEPEMEEVAASAADEVVEPAAPVGPGDLVAIAADLYGDAAATALRSAAVFRDSHANQPVTGSGTLRRVRKFSYDPIFTTGKGVKATVDICELSGAYSKIKVGADVCFAVERFDELKAKEGERVAISGTLIAQDAMTHQFYVMSDA